jgi:hypothetical protein
MASSLDAYELEEARNSVAEALRRLDDLVAPAGDSVPAQTPAASSSSRWELIGNWADYPPTLIHRRPAPTYAKALWKMAVKKICRLLRLRQRWSALGRLLQRENCGRLFDMVERVNGVLHHKQQPSSRVPGRQGPHGRS